LIQYVYVIDTLFSYVHIFYLALRARSLYSFVTP